MRALTIRQPWAHAIVHGGKSPENRTWWRATAVGTTIAIHAGVVYDPAAAAFCAERGLDLPPRDQLVYGKVIGVAVVAEVHADDTCHLECSPWAMSDPDKVTYHWRLTDQRELATPVACRGAQGLWTLPRAVAAKVLIQLGGPVTG